MRWEYSVEILAGDDLEGWEEQLNRAGAEGWELVAVEDDRAYLKRRLASLAEFLKYD